MHVATTMPEISSVMQQHTVVPRLPPLTSTSSPEKHAKKKSNNIIMSSQSEHMLSMHNIGLHNEKLEAQEVHQRLVPPSSNVSKTDLDQVIW
jgi:hypothetical protein